LVYKENQVKKKLKSLKLIKRKQMKNMLKEKQKEKLRKMKLNSKNNG
jgi:hypothetical protein